MKKKSLIYTVNIGKKDKLKDPEILTPNVDYIAITDDKFFKSKIWQTCLVEKVFLKDFYDYTATTRYAKNFKFLPRKFMGKKFAEYDQFLYIDSNILIRRDLTGLFEYFEKSDKLLGLTRIKGLGGLYGHIRMDIRNRKDAKFILYNQKKFYKGQNYPKNRKNDLFITGLFFGKVSLEVYRFSIRMLKLIQQGTHRCQIHLPYLLWKYGFSYVEMPINYDYTRNQFMPTDVFRIESHLKPSRFEEKKPSWQKRLNSFFTTSHSSTKVNTDHFNPK
ncbi:MAG: hypothetical protein ACOC4Y_02080 [bacterium]